jgi:hypothetical protein
MEKNDQIIDEGLSSSEGTGLSSAARGYLLEIAKWGKFLSIVGFIFVGLMVLFGLFFGTIMGATMAPVGGAFGPAGAGAAGIIYILMALLYIMPIYYLYKYSTEAKNSLMSNNNPGLESALGNLKSHYKFMGIFTIVILSIYALFFVIAIVGGGIAAML